MPLHLQPLKVQVLSKLPLDTWRDAIINAVLTDASNTANGRTTTPGQVRDLQPA